MSDDMCMNCVLTTAVPGVTIGDDDVCNVCREYEAHGSAYDAYFKTPDDWTTLLEQTHRPDAEHDVMLMYSGGKDSTYVLYRLVEQGCRVLALTFDNGYIPKGCFDNIAGVCADLGVESVVVSVEKSRMDEVFAESLQNDHTVCSGCFRGLTARGTELAIARGIPIVVTGLSRGQIYETKVHPLLRRGITDVDQIDGLLGQFRELYHAASDRIAELIADRALADEAGFRRTHFVDFFRYFKVTKQQIVELIEARAPFWRKPGNVGGCSSNCLINDVGIHVHQAARGYHNYAIPAAWDIRFGHLTRDAAIDELQPDLDARKVDQILRKLPVGDLPLTVLPS